MVYLTHAGLMRESERSIRICAQSGADPAKRICAQLRTDAPRYSTWISLHDRAMQTVAVARQRERQIVRLRKVATRQIHSAALVRHLRDNETDRESREQLLREFYGTLDTVCATLAEHRAYSRAVSSQVCAVDLLELCDDRYGLELLEAYQREYTTYFAMHCDCSLAIAQGRPYLLRSLLPEVHAGVRRLHDRLMASASLPRLRLTFRRASPVTHEPLER